MKSEKAIEILKEVLDDSGFVNCINDEECLAMNLAVKALEKQIPKKPKHESTKLRDCTCPECGQTRDSKYPYCSFCGQAIDWSTDEN